MTLLTMNPGIPNRGKSGEFHREIHPKKIRWGVKGTPLGPLHMCQNPLPGSQSFPLEWEGTKKTRKTNRFQTQIPSRNEIFQTASQSDFLQPPPQGVRCGGILYGPTRIMLVFDLSRTDQKKFLKKKYSYPSPICT